MHHNAVHRLLFSFMYKENVSLSHLNQSNTSPRLTGCKTHNCGTTNLLLVSSHIFWTDSNNQQCSQSGGMPKMRTHRSNVRQITPTTTATTTHLPNIQLVSHLIHHQSASELVVFELRTFMNFCLVYSICSYTVSLKPKK